MALELESRQLKKLRGDCQLESHLPIQELLENGHHEHDV